MLYEIASNIMRTTINIAAPVLDELKRVQERDGGTLGELVSGLLAEGLRARRGDPVEQELDWTSQPMHARVELADKDAVFAVLDDDRP